MRREKDEMGFRALVQPVPEDAIIKQEFSPQWSWKIKALAEMTGILTPAFWANVRYRHSWSGAWTDKEGTRLQHRYLEVTPETPVMVHPDNRMLLISYDEGVTWKLFGQRMGRYSVGNNSFEWSCIDEVGQGSFKGRALSKD